MLKNDKIIDLYISCFKNNSYEAKEMVKILTKSLVNDPKERVVKIDKNRLRNELIYFNYYCSKEDDFFYGLIFVPLILANKDFNLGQRQAIDLANTLSHWYKEKNTYEITYFAIIYTEIIKYLLEAKEPNLMDCLSAIKDRVIKFSPKLDKKDMVSLQKFRISILNKLFKLEKSKSEREIEDKFDSLLFMVEDLFNIGEKELSPSEDASKNFFRACLGIIPDRDIDQGEFIINMAKYIIDLREFKIHKINNNIQVDPRYLVGKEKDSELIDPIFNKIKILDKQDHDGKLIVTIEAKSGKYDLIFKRKAD